VSRAGSSPAPGIKGSQLNLFFHSRKSILKPDLFLHPLDFKKIIDIVSNVKNFMIQGVVERLCPAEKKENEQKLRLINAKRRDVSIVTRRKTVK
jgi:hypothetical protein